MGTSWLPAYTDKMSTTVEELATDGRGLTVAKTPQGLMYTLNNGHRWDWFPSGPVPEGTRAIAVGLDRSIYVGTEDGLMRSIDSGNSWQPALQDSTMKPITSIITGRSGRILVAGGKGNIAIQSGGDWTLASSSIEDTITALAMDTKSNVIYCGTASGTLARSLDEGETWDSREAGRRIVDIAIRATGELFLATDPPEIYTAASWEEPWTTLSNGLDGRAINVLIADTAGSSSERAGAVSFA
jgi:ligand-binding sensor domain-containing protein